MKIEYYPKYMLIGKLFLDPETLNGINISNTGIFEISLNSIDKIPRMIPKTPHPEGTMQTSEYYLLDVEKQLWIKLYDLAKTESPDIVRLKFKDLENLVNEKTPVFYRESNYQYENREIMKL